MSVDLRPYGLGTNLTVAGPYSHYLRARVICSDGVLRTTTRIAATADTFFSVPCTVRVNGRHVSGFLTVDTVSGSSVATHDDPAIVVFFAGAGGKNADALPAGRWTPPAQPANHHSTPACGSPPATGPVIPA